MAAFSVERRRTTAEGLECTLRLAEDSGYFDGHFPEHPVLPGAAHVQMALAAARGVVAARRLRRVRFVRPVRPGATLELALHQQGDAAVFRLIQAGKLASSGTLVPGGEPAAEAPPQVEPGGALSRPRDIIPHRPPALLATEVLAAGSEALASRCALSEDSPYAADPDLAGAAAVEMAAQTAALHDAFLRAARGEDTLPRLGYLVRVQEFWLPADLPVGTEVRVVVRRGSTSGALAAHQAWLHAGTVCLAAGSFSTYALAEAETGEEVDRC